MADATSTQSSGTTAPLSTLVIFGASGDLTQRKLMPALAELVDRKFLDHRFCVVGVARTEMSDDDFRQRMHSAVENAGPSWQAATSRFRYLTGDYGDPECYARLRQVLEEVDVANGLTGGTGSRVFYFSAPPSTFPLLISGLGNSGLHRAMSPEGFARVVIEKPFGHDLKSATELDTVIHEYFDEPSVFRIDHYLGKETVQNLLALRFSNTIFEPLWNRNYVDHVEITVAESIGVGHRGGFYEEAGALRDIVQNHVMQVLALTLMEAPSTMDSTGIRDEKVKAIRSIVALPERNIEEYLVRAQYDEGLVDGEKAIAYRAEEGVNPASHTETYVAMRLAVDNWRWAGVPIYVRTGKRLAKRVTEVAMHFRRAPHLPFAEKMAKKLEPNSLIVRIQPDSGISLRFGAKVPGQAFVVRTAHMDFDYAEQFPEEDLDGYERLLLDALGGDSTLFIRSDEVQQAWRIVDPMLHAFKDPDFPLARYNAGTWGPGEADRLLDKFGHRFRTP